KKPPSGDYQGGEGSARIALITESVVNIRVGPGTEHEVITQVIKGEALTIFGDSEDWYYVKTKDGYQGWVKNSLVAVRTDPNASSRSPEPGDRPRPAPPLYTGPNSLQKLDIKDLGNELELIIDGAHPLNYSIMTLGNPQRVVIDLQNTSLALNWDNEKKLVNNEIATAVRVGQFTESQARVVVDLKAVATYSVSFNDNGSQVIVKLSPPSIKDKIIVIDPGHGEQKPWGSDPGAIGKNGLEERDLTTDIAWKLWEILQQEGATIIMTRTGDTTSLNLAGRAEVANVNNADIFVCIHINSSTSATVAGTSTYYYAPWSSELGAQRAERQRLATLVQQELVNKLGRRNIGILEENFAVLRETTMPSILAEIAFISNPEELQLLGTEEFRQKAAEGLAKGIMRYFAEQ
ncbi:MAG: N-acetylmuramoyl-L-alanine amidase, partial [Bacillota bacterium]